MCTVGNTDILSTHALDSFSWHGTREIHFISFALANELVDGIERKGKCGSRNCNENFLYAIRIICLSFGSF